MTWIRSPSLLGLICAGVLSLALGAGVTVNQQITFVALVALLGIAAVAAPASAWVCAALVAALTFKGLASLGLLPPVAAFIDLPLAWGALFVALLKKNEQSRFLKQHLRWLAALGLATALAWAFNPSEILRPVLYLMLLGEPFVIVGALLADPPSPRMRIALERTLLTLVLIQIPLAAIQFIKLGSSDHIQGTLYNAGAGAHVISAVMVVGGIWILSGRSPIPGTLRLPIVALLFTIPFIADAKQVIIALPAVVLASSWRIGRLAFVVRSALVAGSLVALFMLVPAGKAASGFLEKAQHGNSGKKAAAMLIWHKLEGDPASLMFGKGPAETVSRAAFLTAFQNDPSPLEQLRLKPAAIAVEAKEAALAATSTVGGASSFNSGTSSTLGVLGDLGIFGLVAYLGLLLSLFLRLRTNSSPEGRAAASGFALFLVLGIVFDWWEQPPFGVFLGVLAGLALSGEALTGKEER